MLLLELYNQKTNRNQNPNRNKLFAFAVISLPRKSSLLLVVLLLVGCSSSISTASASFLVCVPSSLVLDYRINMPAAASVRRSSSRLRAKKQRREEEEEEACRPALFSVGMIADIQYAPVPDGASFTGTPRFYRHALETAKVAAARFEEEKVDLCVNLGDVIDGKCTTDPVAAQSQSAIESMNEVVDALSVYENGPIIHTYGNHELYNIGRDGLQKILNIPFVREKCGSEVGYHSFVIEKPTSKIRFIVIDSYDITLNQRCPKSCLKYKKAKEILETNNNNYASDEKQLNSPEGLVGTTRRYVAFNGALDETQLDWLRKTLQQSKENDEKVIILSHQPIHPKSTSPVTLIWNYDEVLNILRKYSCSVIASFAGHAHRGGYHRDKESGIHFRVIEAALESPSPCNTFGILDFYENRLELRGNGDCESAVFDFAHTTSKIKT